jgi:hypothetical protein
MNNGHVLQIAAIVISIGVVLPLLLYALYFIGDIFVVLKKHFKK